MIASADLDGWTATYRAADELQHRLVAAALACIARWGLAKTTLDDIARQAGVSRATVYRAFPGGKDRLVEVVSRHEFGRFFHELDAELAAAADVGELLATGMTRALREITRHPALRTLVEHEPGLVLPHIAFHRLDRYLALTTELCRPHLTRFVDGDTARRAADWVARLVVSFAVTPSPAIDPDDPDTVRRLVHTYLVPALVPTREAP